MNKNENKLVLFLMTNVVWIILFLLYFAIGASMSRQIVEHIVPAFMFTAAQYVIFSVNRKRLIPKYFETHRSVFYNYNLLLIISVAALITVIIHLSFVLLGAHPSPKPEKSIIFPLLLHMAICFVATWASVFTYLIDREKETKVEIDELKREKAESELKFLKTQINPHFLFNALNNIYSLAYSGDKMVTGKIAMLSDMLRYVIYDCESEYISIDKEVEYIRSYIEFQQIKTEKKQNITFSAGHVPDRLIAPMMLVPFVENAFKHSCIERDPSGFVEISLSSTEDRLTFVVRNSIPEGGLRVTTKHRGEKGIGIENVKTRLKLLYPQKHSLVIEKNDKVYSVRLELFN